MNEKMTDMEIIDYFGGTTAVARLCCVSPQAVSQWKRYGITKTVRPLLIRLISEKKPRPNFFDGADI